jgi:hypothetical protein
MEYSESETLMATLQGWVPHGQRPQKLLQALYCLVNKSSVPHWLTTMGFTFFSWMSPNSYWVI